MKRHYITPFAEPAELIPGYVLMTSQGGTGTGSDFDDPYEMTDDDFSAIFG